jgi:hypothetical protein
MKVLDALKLLGYGIAIVALDLVIDTIDANGAFVNKVRTLL